MDWNAYQLNAAKTSGAKDDSNPNGRVIVAALGLAGEAGELANKLKKEIGHKHPTPLSVYEDELGDVLWYLAELCTALDVKLGDVPSQLSPGQEGFPRGTVARLQGVASLLEETGFSAGVLIGVLTSSDQDHRFDPNALDECVLTDVLDALIPAIAAFDLTIEQVAGANIAKLTKRYPEGFSPKASLNRTV